jgi:hypothetical protein
MLRAPILWDGVRHIAGVKRGEDPTVVLTVVRTVDMAAYIVDTHHTWLGWRGAVAWA